MEPVYLSSIKDRKVGFKNVTLHQIINHLIFKYLASKKVKDIQKAVLQKLWDINENIEHMFKRTQNTLEWLGEMENLVGIDYHQSDFIHNVYMSVKNMQIMKKVCKR